jgi:hypothetical protein
MRAAMEKRIGPQTPYEVYCYNCRVTFPVGTRSCVHCGRPIGAAPLTPGAPQILPGSPGSADELELPGPLSARKLGGMSLWVLLALGAALSRFCAEG